MSPFYQDPFCAIYHGDCREILRALPEASVHAIVTDPPYELTNRTPDVFGCESCGRTLSGRDGRPSVCPRCGGALSRQRSVQKKGFMGKEWDGTGVAFDPATWAECLRVLKPGGHLLAFGGTRTYHRMVCAIEDAGFEIRDQIAWTYGSGFPKSLDVSKAIDKAAGAEREVISEGKPVKRMIPGADQNATGSWIKDNGREYVPQETAPATDAAREWDGWGTALKPAWEPICVARKPLAGTVAENVQAHGAGALNIDGCKIAATDGYSENAVTQGLNTSRTSNEHRRERSTFEPAAAGRWPANLIHDGSEEVVRLFPAEAGAFAPVKGTEPSKPAKNTYGEYQRGGGAFYGDSGSAARFFKTCALSEEDLVWAARFFYCAKASRSERGEGNTHPTVKPIELMRYLVRLVTPKGGMVVDPFTGSGTTGIACKWEGFRFIGIDREEEHCRIAAARMAEPVTVQESLPL